MSSSESNTTGTAQIGVTGLAVMGSNIARNFAREQYVLVRGDRGAGNGPDGREDDLFSGLLSAS